MNTKETLILHALKRKQVIEGAANPDIIDHLLEHNPEQREAVTRNICAHIPKELFKEVEGVCMMLDLNKREVVTMALIDFLAQAHETVRELNVFESAGEV